MSPEAQAQSSSGAQKKEHGHRERIGNYVLGSEIGRGSFATVYKGYRSKTRAPIAIKAVSRQKLTQKLLENLESEINILKAISHRNIVSLEDCFKNDTHIYLVMEYCTGSDLSVYIKNKGRIPTLDYIPRGAPSDADKIFYPHPVSGGIAERVTRCFLGQLAEALKFLRSQNLIHRDIKPQNLLMQPATAFEIADGHPVGIPVLKVADFGFARFLPAAAMAETLCGSPLYMAPEILRYEKYDAKADLWSVGAVLFEMATGRPPFRANNHVELLRKIEKGEDRIKFPDESSKPPSDPDSIPPIPTSLDIKTLIRRLLKRQPANRMTFEEFFNSHAVWEEFMSESRLSDDEGDGTSLDISTSTDSSSALDTGADRLRDLVASRDLEQAEREVPIRAPQPLSVTPVLNPQPARLPIKPITHTPSVPVAQATAAPPSPRATQPPEPPVLIRHVRRSEPKYYVSSGDSPASTAQEVSQPAQSAQTPRSPILPSGQAAPRPIQTSPQRRLSTREPASIEEAQPLTPSSHNVAQTSRSRGVVGEGSPLAATPPFTLADTGKDESALEGDDSVVGREYVVVEKRTVEVNALADEVDQASKKPSALARRPSSRQSIVTRPVSAFKPASSSSPSTSPVVNQAVATMSYSPPFISSTPPFAVPKAVRQPSGTPPLQLSRTPSASHGMNVFPPTQMYEPPRYGTSPSSFQTGNLARALTSTAIKLIGTSANAATNAIVKAAASKRRPTIIRSGASINPAEDELLKSVEDVARKAFVLFELGDQRLVSWNQLATSQSSGLGGHSPRRKSSSSSINSEVVTLRQQEILAGEAVVLFCKAVAFIAKGTNDIKRYWDNRQSAEHEASQELNEMLQWLRARFNECYEKIEWAKSKCAEELPFIDRLLHDKARETSRQAAMAELQGDFTAAENGYETALWQLQTLLDDAMYDGGSIRDDDRIGIEKLVAPIRARLEALRGKMAEERDTPVQVKP